MEISISIYDIVVKDGRRKIDLDKVKQLADSIKQVGLINPITVIYEEKTNKYILAAGMHRLEAVKLLNDTKIKAHLVLFEKDLKESDLKAELIEIDENLIRNELHYTEIGELLKRKKEIYEDLYPETKVGQSQALSTNIKLGNDVSAKSALTKPSFVEDTAAKTGKSTRTIHEELQIANKVIPEAKEVLKEKEIPKTEAVKLARETPEVQKKIIPIFEAGQAKKVEEAKKIIDPVDEAYDKIVEDIEAKDKRVKKVMKLLNYTQFLGITEQSIQDYFDVFPKNRDSFTKDLERLKTIINETVEIFNNLQQIRRVK